MNIKILMLKSLEDIIADVSYREESTDITIRNPFCLIMNSEKSEVGFYPFAPLSSDNEMTIPKDWVVSVVNPLDTIKTSYEDRINGKSEDTSTEG